MATRARLVIPAFYVGVALFSLAVLSFVLRLWKADISIPFTYVGDALYNSAVIKGVIDNGWFLHNKYVGMPTGLYFHDFSNSYGFNFLIIKALSLFCRSYGTLINLFYLIGFPLTTLASLFVFRQLRLSWGPSVVGSMLFSFLPYHFLRGEGHLFLSFYFSIPLIVLILLWIAEGRDLLITRDPATLRPRADLGFKSVFAMIVCIVTSSSGVYYAAFGIFFIFVIGLVASVRLKTLRPLVISSLLMGILLAGVCANLAPRLYYDYQHGKNIEMPLRQPEEAETNGLKIAQMLLPVSGHRLPFLAEIKSRYNQAHLVNENDFVSLGMIGSCGFLFLLAWLIVRKPDFQNDPHRLQGILDHLAVLNLSGLLLATVGGFSSLLAQYLSPQVRAYNRISVYIAFFSIAAIVILLEKAGQRWIRTGRSPLLFHILLAMVLLVGMADQTTNKFIPQYNRIKTAITEQSGFVSAIESISPTGGMIFQLPYVPFPEALPIHQMTDYDHFAGGYLHSKTLRWSYGAMKGREGDLWQKMVSEKPPEEFLRILAFSGFSGISIDRRGYADKGADLERQLGVLLGRKPLVSSGERYAFFPLGEYTEELRRTHSAEEWKEKRDRALHPVLAAWGNGFSSLEQSGDTTWRWCSSSGELRLINSSGMQKTVVISMSFATGQREPASLNVTAPGFSERLTVSQENSAYSKAVKLPPGTAVIKFTCDAKRVVGPSDPRTLVFRVNNFTLKETL